MTRRIGCPIHVLSPGPIGQRTGGYAFLRRIVQGLRERGEDVSVAELPGPHPFADDTARREADVAVSRIPDGAVLLVDGLAIPAAAHALWLDRFRLRITALVHHPLHLETGVDPPRAATLRQLETGVLGDCRRILVPSRATAQDVVAMGIDPLRIAITPPGTQAAEPAGPIDPASPQLLCLATVTPRKGQLTLVQALATLTDLPWRAVLAGSLDRDPDYAAQVRAAVTTAGLEGRVELVGEIGDEGLPALWRGTALFVLPSHHEGYGMAAAEALVRGVPVITGSGGAQAEVVPYGAGGAVPPGDAAALATALRRLLSDPAALARAATIARAAGEALPDWDQCIDRIRAELVRVVPRDQRIERIA